MIFCYIGGVGSGKTVSIVKEIIERKNRCYTNFHIKTKDSNILKKSDIVYKEPKTYKKDGTISAYQYKTNYTYWKERVQKGERFDIYIDEIQNLIHARQAMSKYNIEATKWVSQIRKMMGAHKTNHLYIISQRPTAIDIAFRELAHAYIYCMSTELKAAIKTKTLKGKKLLPIIIITQYIFDDYEKMYLFHQNKRYKGYIARKAFLANRYFQYYDTYEVIDMED